MLVLTGPPGGDPVVWAQRSDGVASIQVSVRADQVIGSVPKELFGVHVAAWYETIVDQGRFAPGLLRRMQEAGIGFLVYPGGNYGAEFRWDQPNLPTELSTDQFLLLVQALGALPKISVNLNAGPDLAARWVAYVGRTKGDGVRYWELGDEPYFSMTGPQFVAVARQFVPAMKAVDPSIKIVANVSLNHPEFTRTVIAEAGDLVDVYSFHFFPLPPSQKISSRSPYTRERSDVFYRDLLASTDELKEQVARLKAWVAELSPGRDVEYHVGSFAPVWWGPEDWTVNSLPAALWVADVLGTLAELQVDAAAYWALLNPYPPGQGDFGLLSPELKPYVSYYPFVLFHRHFGSQLISVATDIPFVSAYASLSGDGSVLYVMLINRTSEPFAPLRLDLTGFPLRGDGAAWILDGPVVAEHPYDYGLRRERLEIGGAELAWRLPAYSVTVLELPRAGCDRPLASPPNLALEKRATASSTAFHELASYYTTDHFLPARAVDGDRTTRWASRTFSETEEWFQLDLGQSLTFNRVDLFWEYWATRYELMISSDGEHWRKVADHRHRIRLKEPPQPVDRLLLPEPVTARYLRIRMRQRPAESGAAAGSSTWTPQAFSLWEVEVFWQEADEADDGQHGRRGARSEG